MIFEKKFDSTVWKVIPDSKQGLLAIELRSKYERKAGFGLLDLKKNRFQQIIAPSTENWWLNLLDFHQDVIILQGYEEEGLPIQKGIQAYDVQQGRILWKNPSLFVKQNGVEGILTSEGICLDWKTGKANSLTQFTPLSEVRAPQQVFPRLHLEGSKTFESWKHPLSLHLGEQPIGQMAIARHQELCIVQTYTGTLGKELIGHWLTSELNGQEIRSFASAKVGGLLLDAFFMELPYLFFMPTGDCLAWMEL